jgi:type II secretory pathway pseudopilin PulG
MRKLFLNNIRGFTLVELGVAVGVGSIAMLIFMTMINYQIAAAKQNRITSYRNTILAQLNAEMSNPKSISNSLADPANSLLNACLNGLPACATPPVGATDLKLYDPFNTAAHVVIAGPNANIPILYTIDGNICPVQTPSATCVYEVWASYRIY